MAISQAQLDYYKSKATIARVRGNAKTTPFINKHAQDAQRAISFGTSTTPQRIRKWSDTI